MIEEPCHDLAHLGHVEMFTPKPEESLHFFVNVLGLTESGREGDSVYLRGWDDYEFHTLKLTAAKTSGMGHVAFRTHSPQALERRAKVLAGTTVISAMAKPTAPVRPTGSRSSFIMRPAGMKRPPNSSLRLRIRPCATLPVVAMPAASTTLICWSMMCRTRGNFSMSASACG